MEFITPIIKASKGASKRTFHTIPEYEQWKESLGGSTKARDGEGGRAAGLLACRRGGSGSGV